MTPPTYLAILVSCPACGEELGYVLKLDNPDVDTTETSEHFIQALRMLAAHKPTCRRPWWLS